MINTLLRIWAVPGYYRGSGRCPYVDCLASNGRTNFDLEGSGRVLIEILSLTLPGGTEENHEKPRGFLISWARFELSTSEGTRRRLRCGSKSDRFLFIGDTYVRYI